MESVLPEIVVEAKRHQHSAEQASAKRERHRPAGQRNQDMAMRAVTPQSS
jgi:hypothetical protein